MSDDHQRLQEFAIAYAQKFWDAGNLVVTLMFGLAFAVYFALIQYPNSKYLVSTYFVQLCVLAIVGNSALLFVLWRIYVQERLVVELVTTDPNFLSSVKSAFDLRVGLLLFNTVMYLAIISLVRFKVTPGSP